MNNNDTAKCKNSVRGFKTKNERIEKFKKIFSTDINGCQIKGQEKLNK